MNVGRTIFSQLMNFLPIHEFRQCVERYHGNYKIQSFSCWDQFLCLAFAQLTYRESLRDIQVCLRAAQKKLYHMGIRSRVSRNTLAHANQVRPWQIYADFAQFLIGQAQQLYAEEPFCSRTRSNHVRPGLNHHRSVSFPLSLGEVPKAQRRCQTSYPARSAEQHPHRRLHHPRQSARCQYARSDRIRTWGLLYPGPRLPGLRQALYDPSVFSLLRHQAQKRFPLRSTLFPAGGQVHRATVRSDHRAPQLLSQEGLSREAQAHPILRQRTQPSIDLLDQQLLSASVHHHRDRTRCRWQVELFFKWIKQHLGIKAFYRNLRERCKDSDLDCNLRICAGGDSQETSQFGSKPLHNSTDFKSHSFREDAHFTGSFE